MSKRLFRRLDDLEASLARQLIPRLHDAANERDDTLFLVRGNAEIFGLQSHVPDENQELFELAREVVDLRETLKWDHEASLAAAFVEACRVWEDTNDHHRGSTPGIAAKILDTWDRA